MAKPKWCLQQGPNGAYSGYTFNVLRMTRLGGSNIQTAGNVGEIVAAGHQDDPFDGNAICYEDWFLDVLPN